MLTENLTLNHLFVSLGFISGGFVIGIIVEKVILSRLKRFAKRTSWEGDEIVINSIKGIAILWLGLAG
ncbi:mechanosensitive ion channel family protein, partial [candidate division WOR-3 bacterium]|nr:mechanosensitive ion channel family protein [candidate division WOR-3 bacterium]